MSKVTRRFKVGDKVVTRFFDGKPEHIYPVVKVDNGWVTVQRPDGLRTWAESDFSPAPEAQP